MSRRSKKDDESIVKVPVDKKTSTKKSTKKSNKKQEEIILHLPISMSDIKTHGKKNDPNDIFIPTEDDLESDHLLVDHNIFTLNDISEHKSSDDVGDERLVGMLRERDDLIIQLNKEIEQLKRKLLDTTGFKERRLYPMNIKFISCHDGKQVIADKTDIHCWWCCNRFDSRT